MIIDWIAAIIGFYGTYLLRKKKKSGFIYLAIMSVFLCVVGLLTTTYGLMLSSFVFIFLNMLNYWEWGKDEEN